MGGRYGAKLSGMEAGWMDRGGRREIQQVDSISMRRWQKRVGTSSQNDERAISWTVPFNPNTRQGWSQEIMIDNKRNKIKGKREKKEMRNTEK